ncbi:elongation of very long chain fatty acids protein 4-like [Varroa jacobsoni]|uniref:elongation of very long chain fatty acids protein 4-like n=1 Tax=Varroa jacobsoni TaxID=62625 RepID=UPI000BF2F07B|nr:elongation of very long chain fatty acids protein 4-like [Varroa jacobsoni]
MDDMQLIGFPEGRYVFERDPRVSEWVSAQPWTLISIVASYLYMVYIWGPKFMRDRKPYELTTLTRLYNIFQVVASLGFAIRIWTLFYVTMGNSLLCTPPDRRTDPLAKKFMFTVYYYWWLRVIDFADTLFFVLRKRQRQITFLHVFHHVVVVAAAWGSAYFGLTNLLIFTLCLNSVVHSVMYSYYFLSTLGPAVQPYLWWKRHLTKLQILQFFIMMAHLSIPIWKSCGYPPAIVYGWMGAVGAILLLFVNFYIQSYRIQRKQAKDVQKAGKLANGLMAANGDAALQQHEKPH